MLILVTKLLTSGCAVGEIKTKKLSFASLTWLVPAFCVEDQARKAGDWPASPGAPWQFPQEAELTVGPPLLSQGDPEEPLVIV